MNWETLMCFGDSITIGARSYLGYPEYAGDMLEKKLQKKWNVINFAVSGFTTADLLRAIDSNFSNLKSSLPFISTILIGTNDLKRNTDAEDFRIAYNQLIIKAKLITVNHQVILIRIPFFTKGVMYPYTVSMNGLAEKYNSVINALAADHKLRTFEFNLSDSDFYDGVHLSAEGSKSCATQLSEYILKDKGY